MEFHCCSSNPGSPTERSIFRSLFFVVCVEARGSFRPAWCAECVPRGKALLCHLRCREFREVREFRERFARVVLGVGSLNSLLLYSPSEEGFAKQDKAPHPVTKNKRLSVKGNRYFILTDWYSVLVFTKITKSYIEDYIEVVIKSKNYECKGK